MGREVDRIHSLGGAVLGIAVTPTFAQLEFARSLGDPFPLLSDWDREVCADYGVRYAVWKGHAGLAKRSLFVIDRDATVRYRWVSDDAMVLPELAEALTVLGRLPSGHEAGREGDG